MPINDVQSTNKQHAVPQNIMDVEFKIIGELTMRQFAYIMVFGGLSFVSATYVGGIFRWPFAIIFVIFGLAFAFVPIEDRGMDQWVIAFFRAVYSPTQKIWKKSATVPSVFFYQNLDVMKRELITLAPTSSRRKLEEYLDHQQETGPVDKLDIREGDFIKKVRDAYSTSSYTAPVLAPAMPSVEVSEFVPFATPSPFPGAAPTPTNFVDDTAPQPAPTPAPEVTSPKNSEPASPVTPTPVSRPIEEVVVPQTPATPTFASTQVESKPTVVVADSVIPTLPSSQQVRPEIAQNSVQQAATPVASTKPAPHDLVKPFVRTPQPQSSQPVQNQVVTSTPPTQSPQQASSSQPADIQAKIVSVPTLAQQHGETLRSSATIDTAPRAVPQKTIQPQSNQNLVVNHKYQVQSQQNDVTNPVQQIFKKPTDDIKPVRKKVEESEFKLVDRSRNQTTDYVSNDRHTGRKFTNLLAKEGEIILPIRGERVLKTIEEINIEDDISEKTNQLKNLINKIKKEEGIGVEGKSAQKKDAQPKQVMDKTPQVKVVDTSKQVTIELGASQQTTPKEDFDLEANTVIETVKDQNKKLEEQIAQLRNQMFTSDPNATEQKNKLQQQLRDLEDSKTRTESEYSALQKQLLDLQGRLKEKDNIVTKTTPTPVKPIGSANVPVAPTKPNVISGIVQNSRGVSVDGVVLLVKNHKGEAVRATKTNSLGQFSLISPLSNGMYTIEVGQYNKVNESFDIISVEVKGSIIAPLVFQGR